MDLMTKSTEPLAPNGKFCHLDALVPDYMREEVSTGVSHQFY